MLVIPEDPTDEDAKFILEHMFVYVQVVETCVNEPELERTRGTPGMAIPEIKLTLETRIAWQDRYAELKARSMPANINGRGFDDLLIVRSPERREIRSILV